MSKFSPLKHLYYKAMMMLFLLMLLVICAQARVVATVLYKPFQGSINLNMNGSNSPDEFYWPHPQGFYLIECQMTGTLPAGTLTGSVNGITIIPGVALRQLFISTKLVQFGISLNVNQFQTFPLQCSSVGLKYKIYDMAGRLIVDWREIVLIRSDYISDISLINNVDLFLQDNPNDRGDEPINSNDWNGSYETITQSQDINNRNNYVVNTTHLNPMHSIATPTPNANYLNFTIRNRSCVQAPSSELHLYWTIARTHEPWSHDWTNFNASPFYFDNKIIYQGLNYPLGNAISISNPLDYASAENVIPVASLPAGGSVTMNYPWIVPNPVWYTKGTYSGAFPLQMSRINSNPVICLLARLDEIGKPNNGYHWNPALTDNTDIVDYARANNNVVTRNTYILNSSNGYKRGEVNATIPRSSVGEIIINPRPGANPNPINIGFVRNGLNNNSESVIQQPDFTMYGQVNIYLDKLIWDRWMMGGMEGENIEVVDDQQIKITNPNYASLSNIQLNENEFGWIGVETEYYTSSTPVSDFEYVFSVGELNSNNTINSRKLVGSPTTFFATVLSTPKFESDTDSVNVRPLNIKNDNSNSLKLFPNPAGEVLYINSNFTSGNLQLYIYDLYGKLILFKNELTIQGQNSLKLDITDLTANTYILKIVNNESTVVQKFVKQ